MPPSRQHTPSIFDKLISMHTGVAGEGTSSLAQIYKFSNDITSEAALKRAIGRDLGWLLNTLNFESTCSLDEMPAVQKSVLNYGVPDMSGHVVTKQTVARTVSQIRRAIINFEPRLDKDTLVVEVTDQGHLLSRGVAISIKAEIAPSRLFTLFYTADLDFDSGAVAVRG
jgi:type VI secretion system protein ImpF